MDQKRMKAARILRAAQAAGVHIEVDRGDLVLEADSPPPDEIVEAVFSAKAAIIALLGAQNGPRFDKSRVAVFPDTGLTVIQPNFHAADPYETAVNIWLNNNPASSPPDRCAWCFRPEHPDHAVVPFGSHGSGHIWLHGECWTPWQQHRRQMAAEALQAENQLCHGPPGQTGELRRAESNIEHVDDHATDNRLNGGDKS